MKTTRRSVFGLGAAAAAAGWARPLAAATASKQDGAYSAFDSWIELHADNLRHNVAQVQQRVTSRPVMAVIKNNAYGGGLVEVARVLDPLPALSGLAVVKLQEAITLRDAGIRKPILLMGPFDDRDLEEAVARDITPMVYTPIGDTLERIAERFQRRLPIHVCIDTGLGRLGIQYWQAASLIRDLTARKSVLCKGVMTSLVEHEELDRVQLARFNDLSQRLASEGLSSGQWHAASSAALFQDNEYFLDMVRPGMSIFGVYPEPEHRTQGAMELRPAFGFRSRVIYVKQLRKGDAAGYHRAYVADRDVWVATLPAGHADGVPRAAAKGARVRIGGRLYPLIGMVSASHCIAEVGNERTVDIGDEATFFDWRQGSRPEDVAAACGASVYDLTMHLNPLLPRRLV